MAVATVENFTQIDNELSFAVQLPDGTYQRYSVSLLSDDIEAAMAEKARITAAPSNDAKIKEQPSEDPQGLAARPDGPRGDTAAAER